MKQTLFFSFKIFMTTILIGPILTGLVLAVTDPLVYRAGDILDGLVYGVPVGILLIIPSWLLLGYVIKLLIKKEISTVSIKIILSITSILFLMLPFTMLNYHRLFEAYFWLKMIPLLSCYNGILIVSIWCYSLNPWY